jgi:hypothetical protein
MTSRSRGVKERKTSVMRSRRSRVPCQRGHAMLDPEPNPYHPAGGNAMTSAHQRWNELSTRLRRTEAALAILTCLFLALGMSSFLRAGDAQAAAGEVLHVRGVVIELGDANGDEHFLLEALKGQPAKFQVRNPTTRQLQDATGKLVP